VVLKNSEEGFTHINLSKYAPFSIGFVLNPCYFRFLTFFSMKIPKLAVFDLAGTTVHDEQDVPRILQASLHEHGISVSLADAARLMGIPKPVAIRQLLNDYDAPVKSEALVERIHVQFIDAMTRFYSEGKQVREMAGASDVFAELKLRGIKLAVDTGFDRTITEVLLKRMGWIQNGLIDFSVTSEEVKRGRPHPDMIFRAMQLSGVDHVLDVAKIGDTASDLQEGTAAGCRWVIGVTTGAYSRNQLLREPHTHLADSLREVQDILIGDKG
jgi:phosphonatase-like hydrolase